MYQQALEVRSNGPMGIDRTLSEGRSFHISVTLPSDDRVEELFTAMFKQFSLEDLAPDVREYLSRLGLISPDDGMGKNPHFSFGVLSGAHRELNGSCLLVFKEYQARMILLDEERMKVLRPFREQLRESNLKAVRA